jgi:hypothetical protein
MSPRRTYIWIAIPFFIMGLASAFGEESRPGAVFQVPYQLTDTNHYLVRVRINGKGPFNLLVDTGAPAFYISTETARRISLRPSSDGYWTLVERLDIEGGATLQKLQARVEDPYQLIGMNALGLPGASIDGILGFTMLARFRMEFDPTRERMTWILLDYKPKNLPVPPRGKNPAPSPESQLLSAFAPLAKLTALLLGKRPEEEYQLQGFLGLGVREEEGIVLIEDVLTGSAAAKAGFRSGDRLMRICGQKISSLRSAREALSSSMVGEEALIIIRRGPGIITLKAIPEEGF